MFADGNVAIRQPNSAARGKAKRMYISSSLMSDTIFGDSIDFLHSVDRVLIWAVSKIANPFEPRNLFVCR